MEEPAVFVKDSDYKVIDLNLHISHIEEIPKIRKKAEALADKLEVKVNELETHELDEEIKELQSILDDLQHFGVTISFSAHSTKKPYPSLNGATFNPGAISVDDDNSDGSDGNEVSDKTL